MAGGKVALTSGTFYVATALQPVSTVTLQGLGKTTKLINVAACNIFSQDANLTDFRIRDIFFDNSGTDYIYLDFNDAALTTTGLEFSGCEFDNVKIYIGAVTNFQFFNNYSHDLTHATDGANAHALQVSLNSDSVFILHNKVKSCTGMGLCVNTGSSNVVIDNNILDTVPSNSACFAIDVHDSTNVTISNNAIDSCYNGILSESSAGLVTITGNSVKGASAATGVGIQAWRDHTGDNQASSVIIGGNSVTMIKVGIKCLDIADATVSGNKLYTLGGNGIQLSCTAGWTAPRYLLVIGNDIFDHADSTDYSTGILVSNLDYVDILNNNIDGNSNTATHVRGIQWGTVTTAPNSRIIGNGFKGIAQASKMVSVPSDVYTRENQGYIAAGEIRTLNGSISTLTQNAYNSLDNPYGQDVLLMDATWYYTTKSTDAATLDSGIGSSATTDYTTLLVNGPLNSTAPIVLNSVETATYGQQTTPILWKSGSGNRYLNMSIKDAAGTGLVCTYTLRVMGV